VFGFRARNRSLAAASDSSYRSPEVQRTSPWAGGEFARMVTTSCSRGNDASVCRTRIRSVRAHGESQRLSKLSSTRITGPMAFMRKVSFSIESPPVADPSPLRTCMIARMRAVAVDKESQGTKQQRFSALTASLSIIESTKKVLPMPPPPRIAMDAESCSEACRRCPSRGFLFHRSG
jgi:hypothetical protein